MPNVLPFHVRTEVIKNLVEGQSIRATARISQTDKDAVMRLGVTVGLGCMKLHDKLVRGLHAKYIEVDEIWGYVARHEKRRRKKDPVWFGDMYTFCAIDNETKLVPSYLTGKRDLRVASVFMGDLRKRVVGKPQISVDGWPNWPDAVWRAFGLNGADVGSIVKDYVKVRGDKNPGADAAVHGRVKSSQRTVIFGDPKLVKVSTAVAERLNLTSRMSQRRLTRLTNAYSKLKLNLTAAMGLHFFHYNFVRPHETIGVVPAVAAGLTPYPWPLRQLVGEALAEMGEPVPMPSGKKHSYQRKTHVLVHVSALV